MHIIAYEFGIIENLLSTVEYTISIDSADCKKTHPRHFRWIAHQNKTIPLSSLEGA